MSRRLFGYFTTAVGIALIAFQPNVKMMWFAAIAVLLNFVDGFLKGERRH